MALMAMRITDARAPPLSHLWLPYGIKYSVQMRYRYDTVKTKPQTVMQESQFLGHDDSTASAWAAWPTHASATVAAILYILLALNLCATRIISPRSPLAPSRPPWPAPVNTSAAGSSEVVSATKTSLPRIL